MWLYDTICEENAYSKGYGSAVGQRNNNTSYHSGYGGFFTILNSINSHFNCTSHRYS